MMRCWCESFCAKFLPCNTYVTTHQICNGLRMTGSGGIGCAADGYIQSWVGSIDRVNPDPPPPPYPTPHLTQILVYGVELYARYTLLDR